MRNITDASVYAAVLYTLTQRVSATLDAAERALLADAITRDVIARHRKWGLIAEFSDASVYAAVLYSVTQRLSATRNAAERALLADAITRDVIARHRTSRDFVLHRLS